MKSATFLDEHTCSSKIPLAGLQSIEVVEILRDMEFRIEIRSSDCGAGKDGGFCLISIVATSAVITFIPSDILTIDVP